MVGLGFVVFRAKKSDSHPTKKSPPANSLICQEAADGLAGGAGWLLVEALARLPLTVESLP